MSQRVWEQLELALERLVFHKPSEDEDPRVGIAPDRTQNKVVSDKYEYVPLTGGRKSFRLLELLPGTRQQDIECTLTECCLDHRPQSYDALSYVWGDIATSTPIQINGRTLMVTSNLRAALLNLRKVDRPCTIWVDAICIDQNKVPERNHQVSIMGDIYRNAARTLVWLGDSRPFYTKKAYAIVEELAAEATSRQYARPDLDSNYLLSSLLGAERIESPNFDRFKDDVSVLHLACASWWLRTWTVQEILLSTEAVIVAGTYSMDWDRFCAGIDYGLAIGVWNPVLLGVVLDPVVIPYLSMRSLRKQRRSFRQPPVSRPSTTAPAPALLDLLIQCRFRQASDPRDKVYALLGIKDVSQNRQASVLGIEPDYGLSASEVYCHTARQLLLQSGNLNILGACTATTSQELPSWVPDWSTNSPHPLMYDARGRDRQTHASRGTQAVPRFVDNASVLVPTGHEVVTVTRLSPVLHRLHRNSSEVKLIKRGDTLLTRLSALGQIFARLMQIYWELSSVIPHLATFQDWEDFARETRPPASQGMPLPTDPDPPVGEGGYDPLAVYWQTLCVGTMAPGGRRATAQLFYAWRASLRAIFRLRQWHADSLLRPLAFVGYVMRTWREYSEFAFLLEHVYERRLGRGEDESLILLPERAEIGDRVVLVKGGRQPLVFRRDDGSGGQARYEFVGEAYVHGLMDGEGFEEGKCVEMRIR
ncbi:heterokaryon incompatibility protein-domain-containing protein [Parachaetomium inaequale]|uniref:Heterokaryon incompatibility protein-domain-containing protein n=1 Tax=Parachaetomium inaequale TaxID=2588326 RepID=A0AAN6P5H1_9PEZI|nr:heterokaryon incompatibility protein-domain-containing protein [Parachaetomium inaequale]